MKKIKNWIKKIWRWSWKTDYFPFLILLCVALGAILIALIANGIFTITNSQIARDLFAGIAGGLLWLVMCVLCIAKGMEIKEEDP